jgi:hypothetical protein
LRRTSSHGRQQQNIFQPIDQENPMTESNSNKPNQTTLNDVPAGETPRTASAQLKLDDFFSEPHNADSNNSRSETTSNQEQAGKAPPQGTSGGSSGSRKKGNKNALLHGVYSDQVILPWESKNDFEKLHQAFRAEWKPSGYSEEQAVLDLTVYTWTKWRLIKSAHLRFFKCSLSEEIKSGEDTWEDMIEFQKKVPKFGKHAVSRACGFIEELKATFEHIGSHHYWTEDSEGKEVQLQLSLLSKDVSSLIEETRTKVIDGVEHLVAVVNEATTYFDQAYQPDEIEKQVDLMAKLDARIEKAIRRLTAIKVFKRVDGVEAPAPCLPESPSMAPDENSAAKAAAETSENT